MEENKFEKQVRQKMDELKIHPSESVWEHVKTRIEKRKDQRWGFLILFFLFTLLFSGGYWLFNAADHSIPNEGEISNNPIKQERDSLFINKNNSVEEKGKSKQLTLTEKKVSTSRIEKKDNANKEIATTSSLNTVKRKTNKGQINGNTVVVVNPPEAETAFLPGKIDDEVKPTDLKNKHNGNLSIEVAPGKENELAKIDTIKNDIPTEKSLKRELAKPEDTLANNNSKKFPRPELKKEWNVGFFISGGISHVGNQFLGLGYTPAYYSRDALNNGNTGGGVVIANPSKVRNSGSYVAGIYLEKDISSKTKFSFGINYRELNTSNLIGQKNDTTGTYSATNTQARYYNNFKFIELPLELKVELGKRNTFPLFWNGGIILSRLINSNALQFDRYTGTYFKDNSLFNKTQIGFSTGLSTALLQNQKSAILLGPYFYYAASQLANNGLYNKKHFVFFGLHTEILFRKK